MAVRKRSKEEQYGVVEVVHVPKGLRQTAFGLVPVRPYEYARNPSLEEQRIREERRNLREDMALLAREERERRERELIARGELPARGTGYGPDEEPSTRIPEALSQNEINIARAEQYSKELLRNSGWTVGDVLRRKNERRRRR